MIVNPSIVWNLTIWCLIFDYSMVGYLMIDAWYLTIPWLDISLQTVPRFGIDHSAMACCLWTKIASRIKRERWTENSEKQFNKVTLRIWFIHFLNMTNQTFMMNSPHARSRGKPGDSLEESLRLMLFWPQILMYHTNCHISQQSFLHNFLHSWLHVNSWLHVILVPFVRALMIAKSFPRLVAPSPFWFGWADYWKLFLIKGITFISLCTLSQLQALLNTMLLCLLN